MEANLQIQPVSIIGMHIEHILGTEAKDRYLSQPDISGIVGLDPMVQIMIINKNLTMKLLGFRAYNDIPVIIPLTHLVNDVTVDDWVKLIVHGVMPFIHKYKII